MAYSRRYRPMVQIASKDVSYVDFSVIRSHFNTRDVMVMCRKSSLDPELVTIWSSRIMLALYSPLLRNLLSDEDCIVMPDVDSSVLLKCLDYLKTGGVRFEWKNEAADVLDLLKLLKIPGTKPGQISNAKGKISVKGRKRKRIHSEVLMHEIVASHDSKNRETEGNDHNMTDTSVDHMTAELADRLKYNLTTIEQEDLDATDIAKRVKDALTIYKIGQGVLGKHVLGLSPDTDLNQQLTLTIDLLYKPPMGQIYQQEKVDYYTRMLAWVSDDEAIKLLKSIDILARSPRKHSHPRGVPSLRLT